MQTIKSILFLFILSNLSCIAQNQTNITVIDEDTTALEYEWMGTISRVLTSMNVVYSKPEGFKEVGYTECFNENPKLKEAFTCVLNQLQSEDNQFMVYMQTHRLFNKEEILDMRRLFPDFDPENIPVNTMKYIIKAFFGKEKEDNWEELIDFYSNKEAHKKFNSDSAMKLSICLSPDDYYKNEYKYIDVLFFQKRERGYIGLFCFFTDKARGNYNHYWKKIEKTFYYED